ncbi:hypothetical protein M0638_22210 [Roseomonas sp. NAR14]|uniref:Uncharacterized protein n=1 Tax=Roseomonas acroporae TaxID=2937791 RepID=A0A9X2BVX3_9PROT|nr:hypothetical protein [Roseomonas acroporae]
MSGTMATCHCTGECHRTGRCVAVPALTLPPAPQFYPWDKTGYPPPVPVWPLGSPAVPSVVVPAPKPRIRVRAPSRPIPEATP